MTILSCMIFCVFTQRLVAASTLRTTSSHFILGPNTELSQVEGLILCDRVCGTISLKYHIRGQQSGAAVSTVCTVWIWGEMGTLDKFVCAYAWLFVLSVTRLCTNTARLHQTPMTLIAGRSVYRKKNTSLNITYLDSLVTCFHSMRFWNCHVNTDQCGWAQPHHQLSKQNTGEPQGCVLNPFLFAHNTNDCTDHYHIPQILRRHSRLSSSLVWA